MTKINERCNACIYEGIRKFVGDYAYMLYSKNGSVSIYSKGMPPAMGQMEPLTTPSGIPIRFMIWLREYKTHTHDETEHDIDDYLKKLLGGE
jgi:hypothetical protein